MSKPATSKMQKILDKVEISLEYKDTRLAIHHLVDAIKLLSRGQQEVMDRVDRVASRNPMVGGHR